MKLYNPWPKGKTINKNSPFGWRNDPFTGKRKFHNGVDVAGTFDVLAAEDGKVVHLGWSPKGGGHVVIIQHENNLFTVYYHGAHRANLRVGDRIGQGQFIYKSGSTGRSTGAHLHFEVRTRKSSGQVDPVPYLIGHATIFGDVLKVDGRLGRKTWKAFQTALRAAGHYKGVPDGRPGVMTYRAIQQWSGAKVDGRIGPQTRKAVQGMLGVKQDGKWGRITISALQRAINGGKIK